MLKFHLWKLKIGMGCVKMDGGGIAAMIFFGPCIVLWISVFLKASYNVFKYNSIWGSDE